MGRVETVVNELRYPHCHVREKAAETMGSIGEAKAVASLKDEIADTQGQPGALADLQPRCACLMTPSCCHHR